MSASLYQWLLGVPLGVFAENAGEWVLHRYVLHGWGRRPGSWWHYHWYEHHRTVLEQHMRDPGYRRWPRWNSQGKELAVLGVIGIAHLSLCTVAPGYVSGMWAGLVCYYWRHRRAHLDESWARQHLPWHYDHHFGPVEDANWCVTWPWFDYLAGTRHKQLGPS